MQFNKNIHCKPEDAFILFGYLEWSLCSLVKPLHVIDRSFHNTIVGTFYKEGA